MEAPWLPWPRRLPCMGRQCYGHPRERSDAPAHDPSGQQLAKDEGGELGHEAKEAVGQRVRGCRPQHAAVSVGGLMAKIKPFSYMV